MPEYDLGHCIMLTVSNSDNEKTKQFNIFRLWSVVTCLFFHTYMTSSVGYEGKTQPKSNGSEMHFAWKRNGENFTFFRWKTRESRFQNWILLSMNIIFFLRFQEIRLLAFFQSSYEPQKPGWFVEFFYILPAESSEQLPITWCCCSKEHVMGFRNDRTSNTLKKFSRLLVKLKENNFALPFANPASENWRDQIEFWSKQ